MAKHLPSNAKMVLDIGCGRGNFAPQIKQVCPDAKVYGMEYEPAEAKLAEAHFERVWCGDIFALEEWGIKERFDVIIFNDVLEHLNDPWKCLRLIKTIMSENGRVVASIPNMRFWPIMSDLVWNADWRYREAGVMDATHLRFFTQTSMRRMFEESGYRVESMTGINDLGGLSKKWNILNTLTGGRFNDCKYPQFAVVAQRLS